MSMVRASRLQREEMFSGRVPNPIQTVERYWPSRAHVPSFAYTTASYRYSPRPLAVGRRPLAGFEEQIRGLTYPPIPCTGVQEPCPSGGECYPIYVPELGSVQHICMDYYDYVRVTNALEREYCDQHPELYLKCGPNEEGTTFCLCDEPGTVQPGSEIIELPSEGQSEVRPPAETTPQGSGLLGGLDDKEKLVLYSAAAVAGLGVLYLLVR